jgi:hypothetical protein
MLLYCTFRTAKLSKKTRIIVKKSAFNVTSVRIVKSSELVCELNFAQNVLFFCFIWASDLVGV